MNVKNIDTGNVGSVAPIQSSKTKQDSKTQKTVQTKPTETSDKLQISEEARRMQQIKNNIQSGYYNQENILKKTAENIYKRIQ